MRVLISEFWQYQIILQYHNRNKSSWRSRVCLLHYSSVQYLCNQNHIISATCCDSCDRQRESTIHVYSFRHWCLQCELKGCDESSLICAATRRILFTLFPVYVYDNSAFASFGSFLFWDQVAWLCDCAMIFALQSFNPSRHILALFFFFRKGQGLCYTMCGITCLQAWEQWFYTCFESGTWVGVNILWLLLIWFWSMTPFVFQWNHLYSVPTEFWFLGGYWVLLIYV